MSCYIIGTESEYGWDPKFAVNTEDEAILDDYCDLQICDEAGDIYSYHQVPAIESNGVDVVDENRFRNFVSYLSVGFLPEAALEWSDAQLF